MTQSILISGYTAAVLKGQDNPEAVTALVDDPVRLGLVRQVLGGKDATKLLGRDAAVIAVSSERSKLGSAYAKLFRTLGVNPVSLLVA